MSTATAKINATEFKFNRLDAVAQFHIARRLAPLLSELGPLLEAFKKSKLSPEDLKNGNVGELLTAMQPLATALAKLPDDEANAILFGLLAGVEMEQVGGGYSKVSQGRQLLFANLNMATLVQLAGRSLVHNFADFFTALPSASQQGEHQASGPSNG